MNVDFDITASLRRALEAISLGTPTYFVAWVMLGVVLHGSTGITAKMVPDNALLQAFTAFPLVPYALSYLIMWLAARRLRTQLIRDDERYVQILTRLADEGGLSEMERRKTMRDALQAEIARRRSEPILPPSGPPEPPIEQPSGPATT